ncbi:MAG: hypothetical protein H7144_14090 [Burkholderiales bacterium]|nr:hypothetical protein [Phycisphaerae bacterium]
MRKAKTATRAKVVKADRSPYPQGWDRKRVQKLIDHYENQTDDQAIAEAEAAYNATVSTMMQIPVALVSKVGRMIAKAS